MNGITAATTYTITPSNDFGVGTPYTLKLDVVPLRVTGCTYNTVGTLSLGKNVAITTLTPQSCSPAPTSFSMSPLFNNGLVFNTVTGAISGTPVLALATTTYTMTPSNRNASLGATFTVTIRITNGE